MTFAYPWLLALLVVPIALAIWDLYRRGTEVRLPFDYGDTPRRDRLHRLVRVANALPLLLLALTIVLVARPQRVRIGETVREVRNIHLLLDISGSMSARYGHGTRFEAAMEAVRAFVHYRRGDAFALTAFATNVVHWLPQTKDVSAFDLAAPFLDPKRWPADQTGGTYIGRALAAVQKDGEASAGERTVILLTDGRGDDLGTETSKAIGQSLAKQRVTLFAVFIGAYESTEDIRSIAEATGGRLFTPNNPAALADVFKRIDAMQPVRQSPVTRSSVDAMNPLLWTAVGALGLTLLANFGLRYTPW